MKLDISILKLKCFINIEETKDNSNLEKKIFNRSCILAYSFFLYSVESYYYKSLFHSINVSIKTIVLINLQN